MSLQWDDNVQDDDRAEQVAAYLRAQPDFLLHNPELLAELELAHEAGDAVSLIERQVRILREQSHRYRQQLEELIAVARENEALTRRLHGLTLALIDAREFDEVVNVLQDELRDQFKADAVELKLFSTGDLAAHAGDGTPALFHDFLERGRPTCGTLDGRQLEYLFGSLAGETGSAALIPLRGIQVTGILAIGSRDADRFHAGKGVDFLRRLGEVVSHTLQAVSYPGA
ncbi:MAG: DUF484 family protein [Gammaproteobacteria bacterium]|jgi:uncharacterized protein YigA (DUF484 family)